MIRQSDLQQKIIDQPNNFLISNEFCYNKEEPFLFCDPENLMPDALLNDYQTNYYNENDYLNNSFSQTVLTTQPYLDKGSTTSSEFLPVVTQHNTDWSDNRFTPHCKIGDVKVPDNIFYSPIVVSPVIKGQCTVRRGRPPKTDDKCRNRQGATLGKLWEFIRDLLLNPAYNPAYIRWERRDEGVFKFVQSKKIAKLWGDRKQNAEMTYEKFSRAMRYYYKRQVLLPVLGKRMVYKFGPNATGWKPKESNYLF